MKSSANVVVIGGGVFGCCAAYELAKAGASVTLIERDPVGAHASGKNPGNLNPLLATPPALVPFALASFHLHRTLRAELAALNCEDYHVEAVRRVMVAFNARDMEQLELVHKTFSEREGFSADRMTATKVHEVDARLSEKITGGLLLGGNLSLDSLIFNGAILQGAIRQGAQVTRASVTGIKLGKGNAATVSTDNGDFPCDALVVATGPWVSDVNQWLGINLCVEPVKGEMLRMRLPGANITHDFTHGLISLYRRGDGEVWVGVTRDRCGFDEMPTEEGRRVLLEGAARIFPAIADAMEIEHLASLRPAMPSGLPLIARVPNSGNTFVINGGGAKGMLLCTGVAHAVRDLLMTGETNLPINGFDI